MACCFGTILGSVCYFESLKIAISFWERWDGCEKMKKRMQTERTGMGEWCNAHLIIVTRHVFVYFFSVHTHTFNGFRVLLPWTTMTTKKSLLKKDFFYSN